MSMGQVGGNYPYGNQGDYQNPNYPNQRYYQQPHSTYYNYSGYGYNNGYGQQQYTYRQPQPQTQPPVVRQTAYAPSYPSTGVSATVLSSSTVTGNSGVQSTSTTNNSNSEAPKTSSEGPGKELAAEAKAMQTEVAADNKSKKSEGVDGGGGDNASSEGMKAVSVLMTVIGVVTSMDMIAKALQLAGFVMKTVGTALEISGTAMDAAGMAMIATGNALLSNPFTAAIGVALISAGTAMKISGNVMKVTGKVLKTIGNVMEKTARAMEKALKVIMRGAKNVARKAMNKFRKLKQMRAARAMKAQKLKIKKLKAKAKTDKAAKAKLKKAQDKLRTTKHQHNNLYKKRMETKQVIKAKQAKNQKVKADFKTSVSSGWQQAKAAPGQSAKRLQSGASKQLNNWKSVLGKTKTTKGGVKAWPKPGEAISSAKGAWTKATTNAQGVNKFSASWKKWKGDLKATGADLKGQFRTAQKPKDAKAATAEKATTKTKTTEPTKLVKKPKTNAAKSGKAKDSETEPLIKSSKADSAKSTKVKSSEEKTSPGTATSKETEEKCAEILKKSPKDRTAKEQAFLKENGVLDTRFDWGKAMRWAGGATMIGVGAAGIQQAYGSSGDGTDPLQYHERFKTQKEFDEHYGFNKPFKPVDYHSGYYDPTLLPRDGSYYGNGGQNPFHGSTYYYSRSNTPNQYPNQYPYKYQGGQGYNYGYNFSQYS